MSQKILLEVVIDSADPRSPRKTAVHTVWSCATIC